MYKHVYAEMALHGWTKKDLAERVNMSYSTFLDKMSGRTSFTFDECMRIKKALGSTLPLDDLFSHAV
jgi:DNA-binding helix-turn-helix protein